MMVPSGYFTHPFWVLVGKVRWDVRKADGYWWASCNGFTVRCDSLPEACKAVSVHDFRQVKKNTPRI